ncbi:hypothetical protein E3N88_25267 [Mikania micrantha]|uniref:Uncharacterized protein n=1 Tax=Mikania micrantha TaxID=192012 RepID=A0A5N6N4A3_9ASTR|nr:hypothetical protein E3N88_25267 [Mikania micrantha]
MGRIGGKWCSREIRRIRWMERKGRFMKPNMESNVESRIGWIKTPVPMIRCTITEKDTGDGAKLHFMLVIWSNVRGALTPKYTKKRKVGSLVEEMFKRRLPVCVARGHLVNEIGGRVKCPKCQNRAGVLEWARRGHGDLQQWIEKKKKKALSEKKKKKRC